mgnify:CR=1 FL=1
MKPITADIEERIVRLIEEISGPTLRSQEKYQQLINQLDIVSRRENGLQFIYDHVETLESAGLFDNTPWENPGELTPSLVKGTLSAGLPNNMLEIVSELRLLKIAAGDARSERITAEESLDFLQDAFVSSFDLAFGTSGGGQGDMPAGELKRIKRLFDRILDQIPQERLKARLLEEIEALTQQRMIITYHPERIIELTAEHIELDDAHPVDQRLRSFTDALLHPTPLAHAHPEPGDYIPAIDGATEDDLLEKECLAMGEMLHSTGLVSRHLHAVLRLVSDRRTDLIPTLLSLNEHGRAEFNQHQDFILEIIRDMVSETNKQAIYGLKRLLERNLLSREPVWNGLQKILHTRMNPGTANRLKKSTHHHTATDPSKLIFCGAISILGQPLGIGQGHNPTCQSARGISMWSQYAPGKLLNMIVQAVRDNSLEFRYEGEMVKSNAFTGVNLQIPFDYNLDPVSIALVPHLDSIYAQMMQKAAMKHIGKDPHTSVNPAFYGHWIQTGFISCYNNTTARIEEYPAFVQHMYASFHPEFNGNYNLVYPVPTGIFITNAKAEMLGFHAISLLRVDRDDHGTWRAYFFNPNSEGRQNWGQDITPSVANHGEVPGESSLPFHEFASRVYAFHYNKNGVQERTRNVPAHLVKRVTELSKNSWGKKYVWF